MHPRQIVKWLRSVNTYLIRSVNTSLVSAAWLPQYSAEFLCEKQSEDPELAKLMHWMRAGRDPKTADLYLSSPAIKKFWLSRKQLEFREDVLYYCWEGVSPPKWLLVVPESLKEEVLQGCHDCPTAGHLGQNKTLFRVKKSFIWFEMAKDVTEYVRTCNICSKNKKPSVKPRAGLGTFHAGARMERVHMDILGAFPTSEWGNKYVLVMVDQFTKWVEIHALPDFTAEQTARCSVDQFFSRFGAPLQVHTDQGKNFDGNLMKALCELYRITKTRTTPYHPSSNGQVERYNRLLVQLVRCYLRQKDRKWDQDLQLLAGAIRSMEHRGTGYSANMMMLGMDVFQPIDILFHTQGDHFKDENPAGYVGHVRATLKEVHALATKHLRSMLRYQKRYYDLRLQENHYEVGDFVYRLNNASKTGESRKLKPVWLGPLVVIDVLSPVLYKVRDRRKEHVLHHDKLKLCEDRCIPLWLRKLRNEAADLDATIAYDEAEQEGEAAVPLDQVAQIPPEPPELDLLEPAGDTRVPKTAQKTKDKSSVPKRPKAKKRTEQKKHTSKESLVDDALEIPEVREADSEVEIAVATDDILDSDNLGLQKLFGEEEAFHVFAKRKQPPLQNHGEKDIESKAGRKRKVPAYLLDYQC